MPRHPNFGCRVTFHLLRTSTSRGRVAVERARTAGESAIEDGARPGRLGCSSEAPDRPGVAWDDELARVRCCAVAQRRDRAWIATTTVGATTADPTLPCFENKRTTGNRYIPYLTAGDSNFRMLFLKSSNGPQTISAYPYCRDILYVL